MKSSDFSFKALVMRPFAPILLGIPLVCASTLQAFDPLWSDGRAEISTYEGWVLRYGERRPQTLSLTIVKEPFDANAGVKAETDGDFEVLKLHAVQSFQTGTYSYERAWTTFLREDSVVKETAVSTDGCGTTFATARRAPGDDSRIGIDTHSYWQGEADASHQIALPSRFPFVDALPMWLRLEDLSNPASRQLRLLPSLVSSRTPSLQPLAGRFRIEGRTEIELGSKRRAAIPVWVEFREGPGSGWSRHNFWFDAAPPHVLLRMESPEQSWILTDTVRLDYWNHKDPGDERLLRSGGLPKR